MVQADRELVLLTNAPAVSACHTAFVQAAACAVVVGLGVHGRDAQCGAFAGLLVEVTDDAAVLVRTQRQVDLAFVHQARGFADLVDRTPCGAAAKQHRGRAAQHFKAVQVEGVALVKRRVAYAVHKHITRGLQRKTAQTDVFFTAFCGQKADACCVFQGLFESVQVAVVHQTLGHHGHRLRNVAELLLAFADGGCRRTNAVFAFSDFGFFLDCDGFQGFFADLLGHGVRCRQGACQHEGGQRQQFGRWQGVLDVIVSLSHGDASH